MKPPITHYKDEPTEDTSTAQIVNQEMEAETRIAQTGQSNPELKVLSVEKPAKKQTNASNIVNAFRQKMATSTTPIELPSIGKSVEFKEISGSEQKELSKIALQNNSRSDIMYCAMINLINKLAVEKNFDIRDYTEFERILVTLNLQQMNKLNPEIKFTCPKCNRENSYTLDTMKLLRDFAKTYKPDQTFMVESANRKFEFVTGWPKVDSIEEFFKTYYKGYDNSSKGIQESMDNLSQVEYITMFVKGVSVTELSDPNDRLSANLEELTYNERTQIMDSLPQNILFDDETGVVAKTISEYVEPMNNVFKYHDCAFCGAAQSGQIANLSDFIGG